ncbi:MAG: aminotransferase class V-fold PLP-dependent enzyme [Chloroflexi bacterium]|nr:aminotransferase class V-fold PLP-dependent enzyme [Chloroflexota bacterium]
MVSPFMADTEKLAAVRMAMPSLAAGIQLNTGSVGPMPAEVAAVMTELAEYERTIGRSQFDYYLELLDRMQEARAGVAAVLGASLGSVALTHATTDGMNVGTWSLDWQAGDIAVSTVQEHAGGLGPLYALRDRLGIDLRFADIGDGSDDERTMAALDQAVAPGTKLVSLSHVLWSTGAVLPIARIAALAHDRGALLLVDGAQAAGAIQVSVDETGADAYAIPGQKWLLGPEGMGALWVKPSAMDRMRPSVAGHFSLESYDSRGSAVWHPDARRFEGSGYHRPSVAGFARAASWLSMYVGLDFVYGRGARTASAAADALAEIDGVELLTPRHQMATLVTFRIRGWGAQAGLDELAVRTSAIARTIVSLDAIRISVGFFTTEAEIERFLEGVRLLAAHGPDSLPPRRTLPIFGEG